MKGLFAFFGCLALVFAVIDWSAAVSVVGLLSNFVWFALFRDLSLAIVLFAMEFMADDLEDTRSYLLQLIEKQNELSTHTPS